LTPDGNEIQGVGVSPDLNIPPSLLDYKKSSGNDAENIPTLDSGSTRDDQAIQISLDILKRSLLLQDTPVDNLAGLSDEQVKIKKRFHGLKKAIEEVSQKEKLQNF
jgi:hypothetical protein